MLLLPHEIKTLVQDRYDVVVEAKAAASLGISDEAYAEAGARIVTSLEAWQANLVLKYKAPLPEEYRFFRKGSHLAAFMHAEGNPALMKALKTSQLTAYAFEFISRAGTYPASVSDSDIAGRMAVIYAAYHLQSHLGGRGLLMGAAPNGPFPRVVIIGAGNVGRAAAQTAIALGAQVTIFVRNAAKIAQIEQEFGRRVRCLLNRRGVLREEVKKADVLIGAILISTFDTPAMVDERMVSTMKPGSVIVDVTCGYGKGYLPSFKSTTSHRAPARLINSVLHIKIDHLPASVPVTASKATSERVIRYVRKLADVCLRGGRSRMIELCMIAKAGELVHPELIRHDALETRMPIA
ncbi:NAD(P)-dependent oxidoreductase [Bradyrhizobium sp. B117]|uniref:NAD(P)-dependent oxidoreductase n=1 Tax=Bradyrhizobium sp. B117 TaxID=3140246 RepID=UPI00318423D8